jgi:hypothetical protein
MVPTSLLPIIAYEVEDLMTYNALRATNSNAKRVIDSAPLKRPYFFDRKKRSWIGRYSERVFRGKFTQCHVMIKHPLLKGNVAFFKFGNNRQTFIQTLETAMDMLFAYNDYVLRDLLKYLSFQDCHIVCIAARKELRKILKEVNSR